MKFNLRLPDDLGELLRSAAAENRRSMNSEVLVRLQASLTNRVTDPAAYTKGPVKQK